jgi:hypothetical protein
MHDLLDPRHRSSSMPTKIQKRHQFFFKTDVNLQYINMNQAIKKVVLELASFPSPHTRNAVVELF